MKLRNSIAALVALGAMTPATPNVRADVVLCSGTIPTWLDDPNSPFYKQGWIAANCRPEPAGLIPVGVIIGSSSFCRVNHEQGALRCNVPYDPNSTAVVGSVEILPREETWDCEKISCTGTFVPVPDGQAKFITAVRGIQVTEPLDFMVQEILTTCTCSD